MNTHKTFFLCVGGVFFILLLVASLVSPQFIHSSFPWLKIIFFNGLITVTGVFVIAKIFSFFNTSAFPRSPSQNFSGKTIQRFVHDVRSPLGAAQMAASYLVARLSEGDEKTAHMLNVLIRSTKRIGMLLGNVSDFVRIQSGGLELNNVPVAVSDIVRQFYALYSSSARETKKEIESQIPNQPLFILGDKEKIQRAVASLFLYALHVTQPGDKIVLGVQEDSLRTGVEFFVRVETDESVVGAMKANFALVSNGDAFKGAPLTDERGEVELGFMVARCIVEAHGASFTMGYPSARSVLIRCVWPMNVDLSGRGKGVS